MDLDRLHRIIEAEDVTQLTEFLKLFSSFTALNSAHGYMIRLEHLSPLCRAITKNNVEIMRILIHAGASVIKDCPLDFAINQGKVEAIEYLMTHYSDIILPAFSAGVISSAFVAAIVTDKIEIVKLFLRHPNWIYPSWKTQSNKYLHIALAYDLYDIAILLLQHGGIHVTKEDYKMISIYSDGLIGAVMKWEDLFLACSEEGLKHSLREERILTIRKRVYFSMSLMEKMLDAII